ncbi:hypothetical protein ABT235_20840 [Micromonospora echinofusca]|uniref:hypothetical protein n=1 Tax=Micromonospora echinofusca TaxID=47858 RepID=UPI00332B57A2
MGRHRYTGSQVGGCTRIMGWSQGRQNSSPGGTGTPWIARARDTHSVSMGVNKP